MIVLVINCGSSSLKYQVLDMRSDNDYSLLAKGLVERIGLEMGEITHRPAGKDKFIISKPVPDHTEGIKSVLGLLTDPDHGVLSSLDQIEAVGHRVAHGGELFPESCLVDDKVIEGIESLCELAPLHNPANLLGIRAVQKLMPHIPQVAVFDTSFHQTMPDYAYMYAIPYECYEKLHVRRYGFHGTSHKFVARRACEFLGMDINNSKIVTCHLGNGGSVTAILNGKSVDTSMGFTPVEGVVMGTRCGSIDAGAVTYLQEKLNLDLDGITKLLNKKSGFLGVSGVSSDCRDIVSAYENGNYRAGLSLNMFYHSVRKYIGAYSAVMGGLDVIVFTGGIGENDGDARKEICSTLGFLGVEFDEAANKGVRGEDKLISTASSKVKVLTLSTNEELVIARDTMHLSRK
ncbi:MAG TPA: acetate kinase [Candidatus Coprenecus stercoravium]|uniref:Acetate kinase n=1 Tax=Candidatus Coprenecus stercoravium TaxID=2840735 RepID=A0A9D2GMU1_9BACT|nr:acetate kinase [Candidatus Coprenecus stercoravium]HIZ87431.1 acetate kinase [Candidatus Coprenecus pullistercoris]